MRPTVHLLATGGTIASTPESDGAEPTLDTEDLSAAVPGLNDIASTVVTQVAQTPSPEMDFATLDRVREHVSAASDAGADAVVVLHGTDTVEESAYYLDLTTAADIPIVFTGAQRRFDERSSDAAANVADAVTAAVHDRVRDGVFLAFNEELHAARGATKAHTSKLEAFESPGRGPVAVKERDGYRFNRMPTSDTPTISVDSVSADVTVVDSGLDVDGSQVKCALNAGVDGIVLRATGLGNTTAGIADALASARASGIPVAVTSRCHAGRVAPVYGSAGGGQTLADMDVTFAGDLPAHKARIALLVALTAGVPPTSIFDGGAR